MNRSVCTQAKDSPKQIKNSGMNQIEQEPALLAKASSLVTAYTHVSNGGTGYPRVEALLQTYTLT